MKTRLSVWLMLALVLVVALGAGGCRRAREERRERAEEARQTATATATATAQATTSSGSGEAMSTAPAPTKSGRVCPARPADVPPGTSVVRTIESGGRTREYRLRLPKNYDATRELPLVLNFHGRGSTMLEQEAYSGFAPMTDTEQFILATPQGINNAWLLMAGVDDIAFTRDLVARLESELCIDSGRVFSTGISNGGFMSTVLACRAPDLIAAAAPVAGASAPEDPRLCTGQTPVLEFHGVKDAIVPYAGGQIAVPPGLPFEGVAAVMENWARINGCEGVPAAEKVSANVTKYAFAGCEASVGWYAVEDGGHTWPGAIDVARLGPTNHEISASEIILEFFGVK